ncbi:MAG: S-layer homology domain-containing protein, partial [Clostridia bacterium]|nr:S-layer homology domain-containing protein [Clostridia bacterium]
IATIMLAASLITAIPAGAAKIDFSDVAETRWSASAIKYAVDNGYMNGVGNGRFDPAGPLTRGMVATVLWRREGSPAPTAPGGFVDVPAGAWYADAVAWAKETGVVNGMTATTFAPNAFITREQLATMLFRFSSTAPVSVPERADLSPFADDEKTSAWAKESLEWAVEAGLINGTDGNRLAPSGNATREQFAAIIERYDGTFRLEYNAPALKNAYTEPEYPLANDADFFVAPDGDDGADGSLDHPFRTWQRAVEAVRALDKTGRTGITVAFKAGDYGPLSVTLNAEDSGTPECPITYVKYGDGDVVFDDGVTVKADEFSPVPESEKQNFRKHVADNIYVADVSGRLDGYNVETIVFSDTREMTVARYPNKYEDNTDSLLRAAETASLSTMRVTSSVVKKRIESYHDITDLKIYGFLTFGWYKETLSVGSYDPDTGIMFISDYKKARSVDFTGGLRYEVDEEGNVFCKDDVDLALVNVSEELDYKGEFFIDKAAGKMYVFGEPENYYFVSGAERMVTMNGVRHVTIKGLDFYNSNKAMIRSDGDGITVEDCVFSGCCDVETVRLDIPENANAEGPAIGTTVRGCEFRNSAGNGLCVIGCRRNANIFKGQANVTVDNNYFTECNLREANTGALRLLTSGASVTHNYFFSTAWEGMDYRGSSFVTAEYNVFERICYNGDDTGAVNAYNSPETTHNRVAKNVFLAGEGGAVGRYCAYLDNSAGTDFSENLIFECAIAVMMNGNRDNKANRNIIINSYAPASITVKEHCTALTTEAGRTGDFSAVLEHENYKAWKQLLDSIRSDPEKLAAVEENAPWLLERTYDVARWNEPEFCINVVNEVVSNRFINADGKVPSVWDVSEEALLKFSTVADNLGFTTRENPFFVNPTRGDYRVKDGADCANVDFMSAGRY